MNKIPETYQLSVKGRIHRAFLKNFHSIQRWQILSHLPIQKSKKCPQIYSEAFNYKIRQDFLRVKFEFVNTWSKRQQRLLNHHYNKIKIEN